MGQSVVRSVVQSLSRRPGGELVDTVCPSGRPVGSRSNGSVGAGLAAYCTTFRLKGSELRRSVQFFALMFSSFTASCENTLPEGCAQHTRKTIAGAR